MGFFTDFFLGPSRCEECEQIMAHTIQLTRIQQEKIRECSDYLSRCKKYTGIVGHIKKNKEKIKAAIQECKESLGNDELFKAKLILLFYEMANFFEDLEQQDDL